jgi:hypothetical protein
MRGDGARDNRGNQSKLSLGFYLAGSVILGVVFVFLRNWWFVAAEALWIIGMVVRWRRAARDQPR